MRRGRTPRSRARLRYAVATAALAASLAATTPASAATIGPGCVGLHCAASNVPEAQAFARSLDRNDRLTSVAESGFYEVPALVYQGEKQPRAVVYVSKPGEFNRMPDSVRNLPLMRLVAARMDLNAMAVTVIDRGIVRVEMAAKVARTLRARTASTHSCFPRTFCLYEFPRYGGLVEIWYGPDHYGQGWKNRRARWASSQVNSRGGDTLLASRADGAGTRYCAPQYSSDPTFGDNAIGNNNVRSVALLGSTPDRC